MDKAGLACKLQVSAQYLAGVLRMRKSYAHTWLIT